MHGLGSMRLLNLERLELAELTATRRGLVETVSELCWFQGHGEPGRPRRVISEVLRVSQGLVGDALEAVRGDELLELGWQIVKSDEHLLATVAAASPWRGWLEARDDVRHVDVLWQGWAPSRQRGAILAQVNRVQATLTTLYVRTERITFECSLPLEPGFVAKEPGPLRPFFATHARVRGFFLPGTGSNSPPLVLEAGWSPKGSNCVDGAEVAERMLALLEHPR